MARPENRSNRALAQGGGFGERPELGASRPVAPFIYNPPAGNIDIIHIDEKILVCDKPSGLLTVPGKAEDHKDCLESRLQARYPEARIVHRLDMDTSGLIVLAMNADAHRHLGLQFERRHVKKRYEALVQGVLVQTEGTIDLPLRCDWPNRPRQMVDHALGRRATTRYEVTAKTESASRVALFPETGRSHQLRVHMLALGHPILGDNLYAEETTAAHPRLCLHATDLEFYHPDGGAWMSFKSSCPF